MRLEYGTLWFDTREGGPESGEVEILEDRLLVNHPVRTDMGGLASERCAIPVAGLIALLEEQGWKVTK